MLDIQESTNNEIQKHPESRDQFPGSAYTGKYLILNDFDWIKDFMQL